jgi:hypothetical protein
MVSAGRTVLTRVESDRILGEWVVRALDAEAALDRVLGVANGADLAAATSARSAKCAAHAAEWTKFRAATARADAQHAIAARLRAALGAPLVIHLTNGGRESATAA